MDDFWATLEQQMKVHEAQIALGEKMISEMTSDELENFAKEAQEVSQEYWDAVLRLGLILSQTRDLQSSWAFKKLANLNRGAGLDAHRAIEIAKRCAKREPAALPEFVGVWRRWKTWKTAADAGMEALARTQERKAAGAWLWRWTR